MPHTITIPGLGANYRPPNLGGGLGSAAATGDDGHIHNFIVSFTRVKEATSVDLDLTVSHMHSCANSSHILKLHLCPDVTYPDPAASLHACADTQLPCYKDAKSEVEARLNEILG